MLSDWFYFSVCAVLSAASAILLRGIVSIVFPPLRKSGGFLAFCVVGLSVATYVVAAEMDGLVDGNHWSPLWWLLSLAFALLAALGLNSVDRQE